jgi:hypothetical protein
MSILNKNISYFPSKNDTRNGVTVSLLHLLESQDHESIITALRVEQDPVIQKQVKESLPCYTVAGVFSRRCEEGLLELSGLAAVDLDSAEEYDVIPLLRELQKIPYIAYAGLSCRGSRLFAIVPLLYPDKYSKQYERLVKSFEDIGLPMGDTCHKIISQPRFVSYNTAGTCFFNHNAKQYHLLPPVRTIYTIHPQQNISTSCSLAVPGDPFNWCETQVQKSYSFSGGNRHKYIISLARYCNIKGVSESDTLSGCLNAYQSEDFSAQEITRIVKHIYSKQAKSHNELPFRSAEGINNKTSNNQSEILTN